MKYRFTNIVICCVAFCVVMCSSGGNTSFASTDEVIESIISEWPATIYYLAHLQGPDGPYEDIDIYITAIDEYTLYVNGKEIGSDNNRSTVEKWTVKHIDRDDVFVGVKVTNYGRGNGNGLMVDIKANSDWMGTTTMSRRSFTPQNNVILYGVSWYYYTGDIEREIGPKWYDVDANYFGDITHRGFKQVMLGHIENIGYTPDPHIEVVTGYNGNIDTGNSPDGGIRLRNIDGENIALNKPSEEYELTDGYLYEGYAFSQDPVGKTRFIDLETIYRINKVVIYTGGLNPDVWNEIAFRGYAAEISLDNFRYEEVGIIHEIGITNTDEGGYDWYQIMFPNEWARYVRFRITESRQTFPTIGEVMVYGTGYVRDGIYESGWIDFGKLDTAKNFREVSWEGDTPDGTRIGIQTKTRQVMPDGTIVESDWSEENFDRSFKFNSPEPAISYKYRVKLYTQDIFATPELRSIRVSWSEENQPVSYADGSITPNRVSMGKQSDFECIVRYKLNPGQDITSVVLNVPDTAQLEFVYSSDSETFLALDEEATYSTTDTLYIVLENPVTDINDNSDGELDELIIRFSVKLFRNIHVFSPSLFNTGGNDNAGGIQVRENSSNSLVVMSSTSVESTQPTDTNIIGNTPNPFNPSTTIRFLLGQDYDGLPVELSVFNCNGQLIRMLVNNSLNPGIHSCIWNGADNSGKRVSSGIYISRLTTGGKVLTNKMLLMK
ncbi:MAG: hypothetical protein JXB48_09560 [Candidatus Latescibacteria bacterium]|nr:hypothetical protein [Candidatus Latescibacterota bacterium]